MGLEYDFKKNLRYPPEIFLVAKPLDLSSGRNIYADYTNISPRMVVLRGLSMARNDDLSLEVLSDKEARAIDIPSLGAMRGIDYEDEVKLQAFDHLRISIFSNAAVSNYQIRHKVLVAEPNIATKLYYGQKLTPEEEALAREYNLRDLIKISPLSNFNPVYDIQQIKVVSQVLSASGTILEVRVPDGKKLVLLDIAAENPGAAAQGYIYVERDHMSEVLELDPYCLPGLSYTLGRLENSIRIVALDYLRVTFDMSAAGTYRFRVVYGVAPLTITDKIRWGIQLSSEEKRIADEQNLEEKIRVGVI